MEVNARHAPPPANRKLLIGGNVAIAVMVAIALVGVVQAFSYKALSSARHDMTTGGVNSLSEGTLGLLRGLDKNIRITSLYFETDREDESQPRYRQAAKNLLGLFEAANRSRISIDDLNPLKDREKYNAVTARLRGLPAYKADIDAQTIRIDEFKNKLDGQIRTLVQQELNTVKELSVGLGGADPNVVKVIAPVENLFAQVMAEAEAVGEQVNALTQPENLQCAAATTEIAGLLRKISKAFKDAGLYGAKEAAQNPGLPPEVRAFLQGAAGRYGDLVIALETETTKLQELKPPQVEEVLAQLAPTSNAILVETENEARVVDFDAIWPPLDQGMGTKAKFEQRAFKGEEKLTAAILRATHKEQKAVVLVRYGGPPLLLGGFMPGQAPAPYAAMKQQLEDANFVVHEWDLKSSDTMPAIDPPPTKTVFVIVKPTPAERGQFGQPSQDPPFGESHKQALLAAMGDTGRALFIGGWTPGPFGPMPSNYEYNDYLKTNWGIEVDTSALLIETAEFEPGKHTVGRRDFFNIRGLQAGGHPILSGEDATTLGLPWSAPLKLIEPVPPGVTRETIVSLPANEAVWGVKNIQAYQDQLTERQYMTRVPGDVVGPFTLGVAATKGDAKAVVISSRGFAEDQSAFARVMAFGPSGLEVRLANPGNVTLVLNSIHWLSDNTQFMNIGKPIESAVLKIGDTRSITMVRTLTIFVWPVLALACGGIAWYVRRK